MLLLHKHKNHKHKINVNYNGTTVEVFCRTVVCGTTAGVADLKFLNRPSLSN